MGVSHSFLLVILLGILPASLSASSSASFSTSTPSPTGTTGSGSTGSSLSSVLNGSKASSSSDSTSSQRTSITTTSSTSKGVPVSDSTSAKSSVGGSSVSSTSSTPGTSSGRSLTPDSGSSTNLKSAPSSTGRPLTTSLPPSNPGSESGTTSHETISDAVIPVISPVASGSLEVYQIAPGIIATGNPSSIVVDGKTLLPGGSSLVESGHTVALKTGGIVVVDGTTEQLATLPPSPQSLSKTSASPASRIKSLPSPTISTGGDSSKPGTSASTPGNVPPGQTLTLNRNSVSVGGTLNPNYITSTLTSPPPDFSTQSTSNDEWTMNTWLTTEKDGHSTIVPVIVGCPHCGGVHGGIIIWGFPELPDVSFQFPEFPDLPNFHLPCIKIFGIHVSGDCSSPPQDDNPSDEDPDESSSDDDDSSTDDEKSKTNKDESKTDENPSSTPPKPSSVSATTTPDSTPSTAASSIARTTTSSVVSNCYASLLGGATAGLKKRDGVISVGGDCPQACPTSLPELPTTGPLAVSLPSPDPDDYQKRAIAGRHEHVLDKRGPAKPFAKINNCQLNTPPGQPVQTPAYPGGYEFWTSETNGNLPDKYKTLSRYYLTTKPGCIPTVTALPANQISPKQNPNDNNDEMSVDHAYENGWLAAFMKSIIDAGGSSLSCGDTNKIFFTPYCNFMAPIYNGLASEDNPDFIVMSQYLNGDAKGFILGSDYAEPNDLDPTYKVGPNWRWSGTNQAEEVIKYKLGTLNTMMLGCLMVQSPNLIDMIQRTNNRIYKIFQTLDASHASDPSLPRQGFDFSAQYRTHMNDFETSWNSVPTFVENLIDNIKQDLAQAQSLSGFNLNDWVPLFTAWSNFNSLDTTRWKYSISLTFDTSNTKRDLDLIKRQAGPACALATGSISRSAPATSLLATSSPAPTKSKPIKSAASTSPLNICPNNAVDENPPGCIQLSTTVTSLSCSAGSNIGLATFVPATWCGCNKGGNTLYPTMTTGTGNAACNYKTLPKSTVHPTQVTAQASSTQPLFPSLTGGAPPAPNESLICQDPGQAKFKLSDAATHLEEYCSKFDGTAYPAITANPSALREFYNNGAGVYIELWSNINTQDDTCKVGQVKFSKADCITAMQDAFNKCHDPNSQDTTGGNAEPFNCANFGFIGNTNAPPATTNFATTAMPQMPAFTCTSSMKNPVDPDYPCVCEGLHYCSQSGGGCGWTTEPAAENCCEDCM